MKYILGSLPVILLTKTASAHEAQHLHHHLSDPNWMPVATGLLIIGFAALVGWSRK